VQEKRLGNCGNILTPNQKEEAVRPNVRVRRALALAHRTSGVGAPALAKIANVPGRSRRHRSSPARRFAATKEELQQIAGLLGRDHREKCARRGQAALLKECRRRGAESSSCSTATSTSPTSMSAPGRSPSGRDRPWQVDNRKVVSDRFRGFSNMRGGATF